MKEETVHATHIRKYCGLTDGVTVPKEVLDLEDRTAAKYEIVENIVYINENDEEIQFRVQRDWLPEEHNFTWAHAPSEHVRVCALHVLVLFTTHA